MKIGYHGKLIAKRKVVPEPTVQEVHTFERNEAQVRFYHGGHLIKEGSTFTDFYGPMACVKAAIKEAEEMCSFYQVTPDSSLVIRVIHQLFREDRPVLRVDEDGDLIYDDNLNREYLCETFVWDSRQGAIDDPQVS